MQGEAAKDRSRPGPLARHDRAPAGSAAQWLVRGIFLLGIGLGLSACTVGPDFQIPPAPQIALTPKPLKAPGSAGGEAQRFVNGRDIPGAWWRLFRSRALSNLMERALRDNFDLKAAQAALRVAHANVQAQRGAFFPTINASYLPSRQKSATAEDLTPPTNSGTDYFTLHTAQLTIAYVPDVFGGIRRQVESLEAQAQVTRFQLEATHLTLTSNIALAAVQESSVRGQIDATQKIIRIEKDLLALLRRQLDAGQVSEVDVAAQEAALAQAELALPPLQKALAIQRDLLTALSGHLAGEGLPERFDFASIHLPKDLPVSVSSLLVEQRPDVRAAEANLHSTAALVGVAVANRLPQFSLSGNVGKTAEQFHNMFNPAPQFLFWTIAGNVTQPIFEGFTLEQRQRAAEAGWDQAAALYCSTIVTAFQNVADALQTVELDGNALRAATAAERAAEKSLRLTREQLELGQVSALQLLNAQQVYFSALISVVLAKANRYADTVALFQALGGGWWNRADVDSDEVRDRWGDTIVVIEEG